MLYLALALLGAAAVAVALSKFGSHTASKSGSVVNGRLVGDYVWVPVGLLGDSRLRDLHEHFTTAMVHGRVPLRRIQAFTGTAGIRYKLDWTKTIKVKVLDGNPDPLPANVLSYIRPALDNHIELVVGHWQKKYGEIKAAAAVGNQAAAAAGDPAGYVEVALDWSGRTSVSYDKIIKILRTGRSRHMTDREAWHVSEHLAKTTVNWSPSTPGWTYGLDGHHHAINGHDVGLCCFPPVQVINQNHLSAWWAHWEQWIVSRDLFAIPSYVMAMRGTTGPGTDVGGLKGLYSRYIRPVTPSRPKVGMQIDPIAPTAKNVFLAYVETCSVLAQLGLLPKPEKFPVVQFGEYGKQQIQQLHKELGIKTGEFPTAVSSFWKGIAVGAATVGAIAAGGPKGWGGAGAALVKGFMSDLGNTGPGDAYAEVWHEAWTPVAVPRSMIGLGQVLVTGVAEDDRYTKFRAMTVATATSGAPKTPGAVQVQLKL